MHPHNKPTHRRIPRALFDDGQPKPPTLRDLLYALPPIVPQARVAAIFKVCRKTVLRKRKRGDWKSDKRPGDPRQTHAGILRDSIIEDCRRRGLLAS